MENKEKWELMIKFVKLSKNLGIAGFIAVALISIILLLSGCELTSESPCIRDQYGRQWCSDEEPNKQTPQPVIKGIL